VFLVFLLGARSFYAVLNIMANIVVSADIILSLVRTSRVGYLRDVRRMTVALSRARLGLYVLGRREIFEACTELRPAFDILLQRPDKLTLVTGELWPTERPVGDDDSTAAVRGEVTMESVEHLGQYVFEMTQTKVKQLEAEQKMPAVDETISEEPGEGEEEEEAGQQTYYDPEANDADDTQGQ
jgi:intron-binding protein aquarius